jgi:hypothetical protein
MASEVKRYRELGTLIRAARAELGARQMSLIEAQERELDPAELDVQIANLGCQIAEWKREYESLFRYIVGKEETALMFSVDCSRILDGLKAETIARTPAKGNGDSGSQFVNCLAR